MDTFVSQSLEEDAEEDEADESKEIRVRRALFRIGEAKNRKLCEDSPVADMINPKSINSGEFNYKGKLIATPIEWRWNEGAAMKCAQTQIK